MFDKVKLALRISAQSVDDEIKDLIVSAKADLRLVGIDVPEESEKIEIDPLIFRAIILYAKAEFNFNNDGERYRKAYDYLKCALSLAGDYHELE